jgi:5'-nucleotidase
MTQPIALIDLDGTVADYDRAMREALLKLQSPNDPPLEEALRDGPPWLEERQRLIKQNPGFWKGLPRIHRGFEVVAALRNLSFRLMVLSKGPVRTTSAWTEKLLWCQEHLPDVGVAIISEPDAKGLVYGRVLVDDWPPFIGSWLERRPRGLVVMLDHPYNRDFSHPRVFRFIGHSPGRSAAECDVEWEALNERLKEQAHRLHPPRAAE